MNVKYAVFLSHVLPHVPNCYEDQAIIAIRNACIDYCRDTLILQQDIDPISVSAGISTYDIDVPTGYNLQQMLGLYYMTRKLERKSQMELERMYTRNWQSIVGTPQVYTQFDQTTVTLVACPSISSANALTGRMALVPTRDSTTVDGVLYERYLDHIVAGALSRLMATPNQPYSDAAGAGVYGQLFKSASASTRSFVNGGMNHAAMRVRFNRIW